MVTAFSAARKNHLDLSVSIALGSAAQIALFVAPVLVLLSYAIGPSPMESRLSGRGSRDGVYRLIDGNPGNQLRSLRLVRRRARYYDLSDIRYSALYFATPEYLN